MNVMKPRASTASPAKTAAEPKLKSGLPGTPEERRRELQATMKKHAETLRRLGR
jgi:hypothetical protein